MFVHHGKLEQLLRPADYSSEEFWRAEMIHLFRRSWQFAGLSQSLARDGDYLAREIAGLPLVLRNFGGEIKAFKNVCVHRHSQLVREGCGRSPTLKCMYHGWEYAADGKVAKIPDGKSFKGIKAPELCLEQYRVERIGPLLFVNCSREAPSMAESLGEVMQELKDYFADHELVWHTATEHDCNWKVIEENAVESYHVPNAHPSTYVTYKDEALHDHRLTASYTRYGDLEPWGSGLVDRGFRLLSKLLLPKPNYERFKHVHIFPNNLLYYNEIFSTWAFVQPLGPEHTRYEIVGLIPRNLRFAPLARPALKFVTTVLRQRIVKILNEDMQIWPSLQRGLKSSNFPGVLSCREERVYAFQQYIRNNLPAAIHVGQPGSSSPAVER